MDKSGTYLMFTGDSALDLFNIFSPIMSMKYFCLSEDILLDVFQQHSQKKIEKQKKNYESQP